jgi:hypothetical protein
MTRSLSDFAGTWQLTREISQVGAPTATFSGQAVWSSDGEGLSYVERGTLSIQGQTPMTAERRYRWDADLNIYFDDGRFFHQVPVHGGEAGHWCDPDQYDVVYDFADWPVWTCRWQVKGPRKDYVLISKYFKR